jgi:LytS/YehU family sensor histidine kinase
LLVETDVHDAAHEAIVPEFLLQPLIENAVKYGMRTSDMPLRLVLRAGCTDGMLEIEVRNTGRWAGDAGDAKSGGIGLENLRNRLELLYAGRQRVTTAEEAGWVSVTVAIPFKTDEAGIVSSPR